MPGRKRRKLKTLITSTGLGAAIGTDVDVQRPDSISLLPTELVIIVLGLIGDEDLYSLSLLSKKLHYLALPILMSRLDGQIACGCLYLNRHPTKFLRAARVALFIKDSTSISVNLWHRDPVFPMLRGLERLISRMSHVGTVSLGFGLAGNFVDHTKIVRAFRGFAETLVNKACEELTLVGCALGPTSEDDSHHKIPSLTTLRSFDVQYSTLSCPWVRSWIIDSINISPITRLVLHQVALSDDSSSFGKDLQLMTLPSLTHLSVSSRGNLQFCDIASFLRRHHRIKNLTLKCDTAIPSASPSLPDDCLPVLTTLRTTPQYVIQLLRPRNSLPSLTHVDIDPGFTMFTPQFGELSVENRFAHVEECLTCLARRRDITSVGLYLPLCVSAEAWLTMGSHPRRGKRRDVERHLVHINALTLHSTMGHQASAGTISLIPKWLSLFPTLQHVDLGILLGRMSSAEEKIFFRATIEACPKLETVELFWRRSVAELRQMLHD
jgi:hypothetical protein